jgi:hypothetical protein
VPVRHAAQLVLTRLVSLGDFATHTGIMTRSRVRRIAISASSVVSLTATAARIARDALAI